MEGLASQQPWSWDRREPRSSIYRVMVDGAQSEYGDIYKVSLVYHEEVVSEVKVKYFDTLPPCASICVLKTGFLFAASEFGNHSLYQFSVSSPFSLARADMP